MGTARISRKQEELREVSSDHDEDIDVNVRSRSDEEDVQRGSDGDHGEDIGVRSETRNDEEGTYNLPGAAGGLARSDIEPPAPMSSGLESSSLDREIPDQTTEDAGSSPSSDMGPVKEVHGHPVHPSRLAGVAERDKDESQTPSSSKSNNGLSPLKKKGSSAAEVGERNKDKSLTPSSRKAKSGLTPPKKIESSKKKKLPKVIPLPSRSSTREKKKTTHFTIEKWESYFILWFFNLFTWAVYCLLFYLNNITPYALCSISFGKVVFVFRTSNIIYYFWWCTLDNMCLFSVGFSEEFGSWTWQI